jgi:hypothetical protein
MFEKDVFKEFKGFEACIAIISGTAAEGVDSPYLLVNKFFHRTSKFEAEYQRLSQPQWLDYVLVFVFLLPLWELVRNVCLRKM